MTGTNTSDEVMSTLSPSTYQGTDDDSLFRTPSISMSLRGRKRKSTYNEDSFDYTSATSKRGRPKSGAARPKAVVVEKKKLATESTAFQRDADPSGLFAHLKVGKNIAALIDNWIYFYENEPDRAIVQLLQLFISCCGCLGIIDSNMIHTVEYKIIIAKLTEEFDEDTSDYPLVLLGPQWKKFRSNFCDFIMLFAAKCKSGAIFEVSVMDNLIQLLTGMADSQLRAFRHTATFAAMKLSSAIVDIVVELVQLREKYCLQIDTEMAKMKQTGTNERLDILLNSRTELDTKIEELSSMIQYMFKSVFVHRYRDVVPDIRCICINELGNWMRVYPSYFLEDSYLKYIGWSLFDKFADVRLKCVSSLLTLYEKDELIGRLELFTHKFKERLVSMVMDADAEVAIKSCQLMTFIYRAFPNLLDLKDCVPIYEIVYCTNRSLALAAAEFLNAKVFTTSASDQTSQDAANESRQQISDLVTFYVEGDVHSHSAYLVDALIDITPMVKDWTTMINMLLNDECDRYDSELVDVMCNAVKQAATGESPAGRTAVKRGAFSMKEVKLSCEESIRISEAFIPTLPKLLTRFIADQAKIVNLTTIPLYFKLHVYSTGRLETHLDELMQALDRIVEQHSDDEILKNVAKIIQNFASYFSVAQHTETSRLRLIDGVALQLRQGMQRFVEEEEQLDEEDEAALLASYRKMAAFSAAIDIRHWDVWDMTINLLNNSNRFQSVDLAEKAVLVLFESLAWDINRLVSEREANEDAFRKVRKRRDQFLQCTKTILRDGASGVENAYLCLCDCLIIFNWKLALDNTLNDNFKTLPIKLDSEFTHRINSFVMDNVFIPDEDESFKTLDQHAQIQLMYKRRNLLGQYCKLIIHGVLHIVDAFNVFRNYIKYHNDFGDIFKTLLQKCREIDKVSAAKAISQALITSYEELKTLHTNAYVDPDSDEFVGLRDLGKRFALSFGPDNVKNREAVAMIHKDGISYALDLNEQKKSRRSTSAKNEKPENVSFLEVLMEFSPKLVRQDKLAVLRYLEKHCQFSGDETPQEPQWQCYLLYKNSLSNAKNV